MSILLIPIIDYGTNGVASGESYDERKLKLLVRDLADAQFNYSQGGRGLLKVVEFDTDTCVSTDISAFIAKSAEHYINANIADADGNVLRFLQDHGAVPEWVAVIEQGRFLAADLAHAA